MNEKTNIDHMPEISRFVEAPWIETGGFRCWDIEHTANHLRITQDVNKIIRVFTFIVTTIVVGLWLAYLFDSSTEDSMFQGMLLPFVILGTIICLLFLYVFKSELSKWIDQPVLCEVDLIQRVVRIPRLDLQISAENVVTVQIGEYKNDSDNPGSDCRIYIVVTENGEGVVAYTVFQTLVHKYALQVATALAESMDVPVTEKSYI
ncbi:MAG: hypothetical protein Tsb009_25340 [Planctomycetaceae bacterium]